MFTDQDNQLIAKLTPEAAERLLSRKWFDTVKPAEKITEVVQTGGVIQLTSKPPVATGVSKSFTLPKIGDIVRVVNVFKATVRGDSWLENDIAQVGMKLMVSSLGSFHPNPSEENPNPKSEFMVFAQLLNQNPVANQTYPFLVSNIEPA